jgi:hypothetical protein
MKFDCKEIQFVGIPEIREKWLETPDVFPDFLTEFPEKIRLENEKYFRATANKIRKIVTQFPSDSDGRTKGTLKKRSAWRKKMTVRIQEILNHEKALGIHRVMSRDRILSFYEELESFLALSRSFAPELKMDGIGQAVRNYIVYAMFVELAGGTPGLNPAAFGYSMLYPFTDNYIDSTDITDRDKHDYNLLIREMIAGREVNPLPGHQEKTCELLQMIADKYPRNEDDSIYTLLQMMQEAQEQSLRQQDRAEHLPESDRLDISLFKGGLSVLIDRCFVDRELSSEDMLFYFGFGFFLQLADDLQDISEDVGNGHQTLMTLDVSFQASEKNVNKLFWFVRRIAGEYKAEKEDFKQFVLENCYMLLCTSVFGSKKYFSPEYCERLQKYMSISAQYWESARKSPLLIDNEEDSSGVAGKFSEAEALKMLDVMVGRDPE